jgi:hypothetical protein
MYGITRRRKAKPRASTAICVISALVAPQTPMPRGHYAFRGRQHREAVTLFGDGNGARQLRFSGIAGGGLAGDSNHISQFFGSMAK